MPSPRSGARTPARTRDKAAAKNTRQRYQVPAVQRAFSILDTLKQSSFGLTVQEVSRAHRIPYSTAFYRLTGHLAILEKDEAVYIERSEPKGFIRLNTWIGERKLLHRTASKRPC